MKAEFRTKLLQHLMSKKNAEKGFTLIELLVVIIIIGILAAIALPSFLNQAAKARQSEARTYVGSMVRAQQAYYLEKQSYADSFNALAKEQGTILTETENYKYAIFGAARLTIGTDASGAITATPREASLKAYAGITQLVVDAGVVSNPSVLCEAITAGSVAPAVAPARNAATFSLSASAAPRCNTTNFVPIQ